MYNLKNDLYFNNHQKNLKFLMKKTKKDSISIKNNKKRKMFFTKGKQPILASGIILKYKNKFIMQCETNIWTRKVYLSDFGGKIELYDKSPYLGAIREFMEETNGYLVNMKHNKFTKYDKNNFLKNYLNILGYSTKAMYIKNSKYLLFFIEIDILTFIKIIKMSTFFKETENNGIYHKIIILENLDNYKNFLHPRLNSIF